MILKKGIFLKKKEEFDSDFILSPIESFNRDTYINIRIILRLLLVFPFAFFIGNSIYANATNFADIFTICGLALGLYILGFYLLQIPHEFIHYFIYSKGFKDEKAIIKIINRKRLFTSVYNGSIKRNSLITALILPVIFINGMLIIMISLLGNTILLSSFLLASMVLSVEDLLNIILSFSKNYSEKIVELPNNYEYILEEQIKL